MNTVYYNLLLREETLCSVFNTEVVCCNYGSLETPYSLAVQNFQCLEFTVFRIFILYFPFLPTVGIFRGQTPVKSQCQLRFCNSCCKLWEGNEISATLAFPNVICHHSFDTTYVIRNFRGAKSCKRIQKSFRLLAQWSTEFIRRFLIVTFAIILLQPLVPTSDLPLLSADKGAYTVILQKG